MRLPYTKRWIGKLPFDSVLIWKWSIQQQKPMSHDSLSITDEPCVTCNHKMMTTGVTNKKQFSSCGNVGHAIWRCVYHKTVCPT